MTTLTPICRQDYRALPRRSFSRQAKRDIVEEMLRSPVSLAQFSRERDLHYNLLSKWRREYFAGKFGPPGTAHAVASQWVPVVVPDAGAVVLATTAESPTLAPEQERTAPPLRIVLRHGEIHIDGAHAHTLLRSVIEALK